MSRLLPVLAGPTDGHLTLPRYGGRLEGAADHSVWPVAAPRVRRGRPLHERAAELLRRLAAQPRLGRPRRWRRRRAPWRGRRGRRPRRRGPAPSPAARQERRAADAASPAWPRHRARHRARLAAAATSGSATKGRQPTCRGAGGHPECQPRNGDGGHGAPRADGATAGARRQAHPVVTLLSQGHGKERIVSTRRLWYRKAGPTKANGPERATGNRGSGPFPGIRSPMGLTRMGLGTHP